MVGEAEREGPIGAAGPGRPPRRRRLSRVERIALVFCGAGLLLALAARTADWVN